MTNTNTNQELEDLAFMESEDYWDYLDDLYSGEEAAGDCREWDNARKCGG